MSLKSELKTVKWLKCSDIVKQTLLVIGVTIASGAISLAFDTAIQYLISSIL